MSDSLVRPYRPGDREGIYAVHRATLALGRPLPFPVADFDLLQRYFLDYYLVDEPSGVIVAEDGAGRLVGYMCGSTNMTAVDRWQRREAVWLAWHWARHWHRYDPFTRLYYRLRLRDAREVMRHPTPPMPAMVHFCLRPEARGSLWPQFVRQFFDYAHTHGVAEIGGEISLPERRSDAAAFRRVGFRVVHRAPHHTLSVVLGEPVWRVGITCREVDLHL